MAAGLLPGGTAVITGAASGIGQAAAVGFAREGCSQLLLGDTNIDGLEQTKKLVLQARPDTAVEISRLDVCVEASVEEFHALAVSIFGRIDYAVNSAGYGHVGTPAHELSEEEWDRSYLVNQRGVFFCERAQLAQMLKQSVLPKLANRGSILNITSLCQTTPMDGFSAYSASKGGALGLTKSDALDYGPDNIRVNALAPGNTTTPMLIEAVGDKGLKLLASRTPMKRNAKPEEIADAIVWLSSPRASFVTGTTLTVDGGYNLRTGPN